MKYAILAIDVTKSNRGNRLIEKSIRLLLNLPEPAVSVSMFCHPSERDIADINMCDFLLLPGATILAKAKGNSDALICLEKVQIPIFCVGAGGWSGHPMYIEAMKLMTPPLSIRDPISYQFCIDNDIEAIFTGCPTLFLPKISVPLPKVNRTIFGFARTHIETQKQLLLSLKADGENPIVAIQERFFSVPFANECGVDYFLYDDITEVMNHYASCTKVVTGRLHGVLPALSQDRPVFFFGNKRDSRFSLLTYLNIPVHKIIYPQELYFEINPRTADRIESLRESFCYWAKTVLGISVNPNILR